MTRFKTFHFPKLLRNAKHYKALKTSCNMPAGLLSLKRSGNTSKLQKKLDTLFYMWYDYIDFGLEGSEKNVKNSSTQE